MVLAATMKEEGNLGAVVVVLEYVTPSGANGTTSFVEALSSFLASDVEFDH